MSSIEFNNTKVSTEQPHIVDGAIEEIKKTQNRKEAKPASVVVQYTEKKESSVQIPAPKKEVSGEDIEKIAEMLEGMEENLRKSKIFLQNGEKSAKTNNEDTVSSYDFSGSLEALFEALIAIFMLTRESRQIAAEQRRTSQMLNISILEEQAASLRNAANWAVGTAVLSGIVAAVSVGVGVFNVKNSLNTVKTTTETSGKMEQATKRIKELEDDLLNNDNFLPNSNKWVTAAQQNTARANRMNAQNKVKNLKDKMPEYQKELEEAAARSRTNDTMGYAASAASQALSGAVSSMGSAASAKSQAEVKELDAESTETQVNTEVAKEKTSSNDQLLGDVVAAFRTLAESLISALRQGTIYV